MENKGNIRVKIWEPAFYIAAVAVAIEFILNSDSFCPALSREKLLPASLHRLLFCCGIYLELWVKNCLQGCSHINTNKPKTKAFLLMLAHIKRGWQSYPRWGMQSALHVCLHCQTYVGLFCFFLFSSSSACRELFLDRFKPLTVWWRSSGRSTGLRVTRQVCTHMHWGLERTNMFVMYLQQMFGCTTCQWI